MPLGGAQMSDVATRAGLPRGAHLATHAELSTRHAQDAPRQVRDAPGRAPRPEYATRVAEWGAQVRAFQRSVALFQGVAQLRARRRVTVRRPMPAPTGSADGSPSPSPQETVRLTDEVPASGRVVPAHPAGTLTRRQREVAELVTVGLTNAEIAGELVLTTGTVANHIEHILDRLGLRNRAQIAAWAIRHLPTGDCSRRGGGPPHGDGTD
jgi:DNA-binding CsgD family transcriptional regulator